MCHLFDHNADDDAVLAGDPVRLDDFRHRFEGAEALLDPSMGGADPPDRCDAATHETGIDTRSLNRPGFRGGRLV
ncbi:hypothetical protein [Ralstonia solanacearum]|uniref:hypothetical protein n=1 Tax=Ralstonia solanacearum TaxID=305 RepID=UPI000A5C2720|nr:hypothetical protein [Ralstonia solanacearum]MCG3576472.1 hypothetical protein [Ralstonia solanacearum]MCL9823613.1 hypothetical protein [Ralstonia solanacearum]MCL9832225.1 hypothetical protein [Ralstonia solanacearum]MCL9837006.1 hypothetical protein [Ralstonia solanacearum]MCL9839132.1 hypothetical protein [Ralstonia solanacearum]